MSGRLSALFSFARIEHNILSDGPYGHIQSLEAPLGLLLGSLSRQGHEPSQGEGRSRRWGFFPELGALKKTGLKFKLHGRARMRRNPETP